MTIEDLKTYVDKELDELKKRVSDLEYELLGPFMPSASDAVRDAAIDKSLKQFNEISSKLGILKK